MVVPFIVVSVAVCVAAALLAVLGLGRLLDRWSDMNAAQVARVASAHIRSDGDSLLRQSRMVAQGARLRSAAARHDRARVTALLVSANRALECDGLTLLDGEGRVFATTGRLGLAVGSRPFHRAVTDGPTLESAGATFTLSASAAVIVPNDAYRLVASTTVDRPFLKGVSAEAGAELCLYDADARPVAFSAVSDDAGSHSAEVTAARGAIENGRTMSSGRSIFRAWDSSFRFAAVPLRLAGSAQTAALVAVVDRDVTGGTRMATVGLIVLLSSGGVLVLTLLGTTVTRTFTQPLAALSEGARRIADGDFNAKVEVRGDNELAGLADTFNAMTDSLRDRSDSLGKKLLELATLYEMSRALGSTLEMDVLLESVLDSALRIFDVDLGYVTLRNGDTGTLEMRASRGRAKSAEQAVRGSMAEWVIREGRPLIFNPTTGGEPQQVDAVLGACAAMCVPLTSGDGVSGAITVGSDDAQVRFSSDDVRLLSTMANHVTIAIGNIDLFSSLQDAYLATVRSLAAAVDAKDSYTRGHSDTVAQFSMMIAERLGLSAEQRTALEMAAYLHDIGKIGIREDILLKPGRLDEAEYLQMKHHPLIGANILRPVAFPWPIAPVVRHHHEHFDGSGYPAGLRGEEIPLLARILTAADAYEAMISDRPYRTGRPPEDAVAELLACRGSHFDPRIVDAFVAALADAEKQSPHRSPAEDVRPEEAAAVLVAVCDGMFAAFRKLGGPRLAGNLADEFAKRLHAEGVLCSFTDGHLAVNDVADAALGEAEMRRIVAHLSSLMERTAGRSLVDHFYAETVETLSERLARIASALDLYDAAA